MELLTPPQSRHWRLTVLRRSNSLAHMEGGRGIRRGYKTVHPFGTCQPKVPKSVKRKASEVKLQHHLRFLTEACMLTSRFVDALPAGSSQFKRIDMQV